MHSSSWLRRERPRILLCMTIQSHMTTLVDVAYTFLLGGYLFKFCRRSEISCLRQWVHAMAICVYIQHIVGAVQNIPTDRWEIGKTKNTLKLQSKKSSLWNQPPSGNSLFLRSSVMRLVYLFLDSVKPVDIDVSSHTSIILIEQYALAELTDQLLFYGFEKRFQQRWSVMANVSDTSNVISQPIHIRRRCRHIHAMRLRLNDNSTMYLLKYPPNSSSKIKMMKYELKMHSCVLYSHLWTHRLQDETMELWQGVHFHKKLAVWTVNSVTIRLREWVTFQRSTPWTSI